MVFLKWRNLLPVLFVLLCIPAQAFNQRPAFYQYLHQYQHQYQSNLFDDSAHDTSVMIVHPPVQTEMGTLAPALASVWRYERPRPISPWQASSLNTLSSPYLVTIPHSQQPESQFRFEPPAVACIPNHARPFQGFTLDERENFQTPIPQTSIVLPKDHFTSLPATKITMNSSSQYSAIR